MNTFEFDGVNCADYGAYIHSMYPANVPMKSVTTARIPGRNGDLILPDRSFLNVEISYQIFFKSNFAENYKALIARLLSPDGYSHLKDTWDPDYIRFAYLENCESDIVSKDLNAGAATLTFVCKPQRYLLSGFTAETFLSSGTITNPTLYASKPLLRVYGAGSATINGITLTIASHGYPYTDIDCEAMSCFYTTQSLNQYVSFDGYEYPTLDPGENAITLTSVSKIDITPRWWTI